MSSSSCDEIFSHPGKILRDHLFSVAKIAKESALTIPLNFLDLAMISDMAYVIGLYHDIGKATTFFQEYLKESNPDQKAKLKNRQETNHSLISAVATYFAVEELLKDKKLENEFKPFLPVASFLAVRRHHTDLRSAIEDLRLGKIDVLNAQVKALNYRYLSFIPLPYIDVVWDKLKKINTNNGWPLRKIFFLNLINSIETPNALLYLIQNILYSLLLDADKHEVTVGSHIERNLLRADMVEVFRRNKGFNKSTKLIDKIRNEIYQVVTEQVKNIDLDSDHILSLTAPTGSGKTLTSLAFALNLRQRIIEEKRYLPRIIYTLPFLSIIDQNAKVIEEVFETTDNKSPTSEQFLIHHHLADYTYRTEDSDYETDASEILIEGWDSEVIITTFVQLFHTLFSNRNRVLRKFHKIAGSIILLDEIQALPHKYWKLFQQTAETMAKYFNTYFILCTATQPAIFPKTKELLTKKEDYFKSFNRTQIKLDIKRPKTIAEFVNEFTRHLADNQNNSIMVVLNTIRSAEDFYRGVKETAKNFGYKIYFLSSCIVPKERLHRIEQIRSSHEKKLVISTQLVEAGVDIDLEKIIRDLGPFDSINQVAGRSNRNSSIKQGTVEIVKLKDDKNNGQLHSYVYDNILIESTEKILQTYSTINEDAFLGLATQYYEQIRHRMSDDESNEYLNAIKMLNYDEIGKFALIKEKGERIDIFVELDDEATSIWNQYQNIMTITNLWDRKMRFLKIKNNFYRYVISVSLDKAKDNLPPENLGIRFISKNQLEEYYDLETGYKAISKTVIW